MSEWRCGDLPVMEGAITLPSVGCWTATIETDSDEVLSGEVVIAHDSGREWRGAIVRGRVAQAVGRWLIVGGTGGLRTPLNAKPYQSATLDDVLIDVLNEVGEALSPESTALFAFGFPIWLRLPGPAHHAVAEVARVAGLAWRVRADGRVWLGADEFEPTETPTDFDLMGEVSSAGRLMVAGDVLGLLPGTFITLPDGDGLRIDTIEHRIQPVGSHSLIWRSDQ